MQFGAGAGDDPFGRVKGSITDPISLVPSVVSPSAFLRGALAEFLGEGQRRVASRRGVASRPFHGTGELHSL